jgi:anti-sigma B factor antagonist
MDITMTRNGNALTAAPAGRLDTTTAPEFENALKEACAGVTELTLDLENLDYISSAGLRVLLTTHKRMLKQGSMKLCHVNEIVMDIFEVTGFSDILTIER